MNVVFMGFQTWGTSSLAALLRSRHTVSLVITHPNSHHDYETIWCDSVKGLAESHGIPVFETRRVEDECWRGIIRDSCADLLVLSDWRTWVPPEIYRLPKYEAINIHDALLPRYGGFAPINWAIVNGEAESGVTVHYLAPELDLGDIILQRRFPIGIADTATDVFHRVIKLIPQMTLEALDAIEGGVVTRVAQDRSQATFFHKRTVRESAIDWNRTNIDVYNLIRGQSDPYPNAFTFYAGRQLKIKKASLPSMMYGGSPGRLVCRVADGVVVICGSGSHARGQGLVIDWVQEVGGEPVRALEYFDRMGQYLETRPPELSLERLA